MGYYPKSVERSDRKHGDHIFYYSATIPHLPREIGLYTHHGIYIKDEAGGEDRVIHFDWRDHRWTPLCLATGKNYANSTNCTAGCCPSPFAIRKSCVDCFLHGKVDRELYRCEYGQRKRDVVAREAGTCSSQPGDRAEDVVQRATEAYEDREGRWSGSWTPWKNCESFAYYCKTGKVSIGKQMKRLFPLLVPVESVAVRLFQVPRRRGVERDAGDGSAENSSNLEQ